MGIQSTLFGCVALALAAPVAAETAEKSALDDYIQQQDDSFRWAKRRSGKVGITDYVELTLTSQTWKGIPWKHQLFILRPSSAPKETKHALLMITGGAWRAELERPPAKDSKLPQEAKLFAAVAEKLKTPMAILLQVPHQPILGGRVEDDAIAHTFAQFIRTGDGQWPLLLPMAKSAVRGIDAIQQFAKEEWEMDLRSFTLTGASKRGWTTWLVAAADPRVTAAAPMVIDMLNMVPQMKHQVEVWGDYSRMLDDYTELGLPKHLNTPQGKALQAIVDPYSYRERIKQPKLIMLGTNDDYWPVDALNLYWDGLVGEKYILYVPNNRHGLTDYGRVVGSLQALHAHTNGGPKLPKMTWKFAETDAGVRLTVNSSKKPQTVRAWIASTKTRDFRPAKWLPYEMDEAEGEYTYRLAPPKSGNTAMFGEAVFAGDGLSFYLSTTIRVVKAASAE